MTLDTYDDDKSALGLSEIPGDPFVETDPVSESSPAAPAPPGDVPAVKPRGISPKLIGAVIGAVLSYLLVQQLVDFPAMVDLTINAASVALGAYLLGPGAVEPADE